MGKECSFYVNLEFLSKHSQPMQLLLNCSMVSSFQILLFVDFLLMVDWLYQVVMTRLSNCGIKTVRNVSIHSMNMAGEYPSIYLFYSRNMWLCSSSIHLLKNLYSNQYLKTPLPMIFKLDRHIAHGKWMNLISFKVSGSKVINISSTLWFSNFSLIVYSLYLL